MRILVTDRAEVLAELHEPGATYSVSGDLHPQLKAWVRAGEVTLPTRPKGPLPDPPVHMPDGTARALLDEAREEQLG